jgi:uncharacterized membrane protein
MKRVLIAVLVIVLFGAALYGLLAVDASGPAPARARDAAPPDDHIDESSRDALRDILREDREGREDREEGGG